MVWQELNTNKYKEWEEGETLEGIYVGLDGDEALKIDTGKEVVYVKKTSMLETAFGDVKVGKKVRVTFKEFKKTKKGFDMMVFKVEKWSEE